MKELKTYAHLYLGCDVRVQKKGDIGNIHIGRICEVTSGSNNSDWIKVWFDQVIKVTDNHFTEMSSNSHHYFLNHDEIKLILRPLSDMTEEEMREYIALRGYKNVGNATLVTDGIEFEHPGLTTYISFDHNKPSQLVYLLSRGFDLFGLCDAGLAVSKTETK